MDAFGIREKLIASYRSFTEGFVDISRTSGSRMLSSSSGTRGGSGPIPGCPSTHPSVPAAASMSSSAAKAPVTQQRSFQHEHGKVEQVYVLRGDLREHR